MVENKEKDNKNSQLADELIKIHNELKTIRQERDSLTNMCAEYFYPNRNDLYHTRSTGEKKGTAIYDGSPTAALRIWSDGMQGYTISTAIRWFMLKMGAWQLNEDETVKTWLQEVEQILYSSCAKSNLYGQVTPFFDDAGWNGSATMFSEISVAKGKVIFHTEDPNMVWFSLDEDGNVNRWSRELKLTVENAVKKFGKENVSDKIKSAIADKKYNQKVDYIHCVYENTDRDVTKNDNKNMPYKSVYIEIGDKRVAKESGFMSKPAFTWRVRKYSNLIYGVSPAADALVEALKLNTYGKTNTAAAHLMVNPAYMVPATLKGKASISPGKINYYDDNRNLITAIQSGVNLPAGIDILERVQKAIEDHFNVDFFLTLTRSERQKTAYEVMQLMGEKAVLMGPKVGNLIMDFFDPLIDRIFEAETEFGNIPPLPPILAEQAEQIDVEYIGPLAQAQKKLFKTQGINEGLETMRPVFEMFPNVLNKIKPEVLIEEQAEATGFPQKALRGDDEYAAILDQQAQKQAAAEQMAMAEQAANSVPKLQKATEAGSPLEALAGAMQA